MVGMWMMKAKRSSITVFKARYKKALRKLARKSFSENKVLTQRKKKKKERKKK